MARYLGPAQYGVFNYTLSLVILLQTFAALGMRPVVRKTLIQKPETTATTLGTSVLLHLLSGGFLYLGLTVVHRAMVSDAQQQGVLIFLGLTLITDCYRYIEINFNCKGDSKWTVISSSIPLILCSAARILGIQWGLGLTYFARVYALEFALVLVLHVILYQRKSTTRRVWGFSLSTARMLLSKSWPLIFSGLAINVYSRVDQIMLGNLIGDRAVGEYAAAARLSNMWYVIPVLLFSSLSPPILQVKESNEALFMKQFQRFSDLNAALAYGIIIPTTLFSSTILWVIFGDQYVSSSVILSLHIWSCLFVFLEMAKSVYTLGEGLFKITMGCNVGGAVLNVVLNAFLIPRYGGVGAAMATVSSLVFSTMFITGLFPHSRPACWTLIRSILLPFRLEAYRPGASRD